MSIYTHIIGAYGLENSSGKVHGLHSRFLAEVPSAAHQVVRVTSLP